MLRAYVGGDALGEARHALAALARVRDVLGDLGRVHLEKERVRSRVGVRVGVRVRLGLGLGLGLRRRCAGRPA